VLTVSYISLDLQDSWNSSSITDEATKYAARVRSEVTTWFSYS
jgi:hypothetical protein